ncbi:serine hydrolase domain-containing protein [Alteriqipengyuania lutimaris]|uniref:Class C beta-lactamase-related serine hydrolase n=1 Tax=Alteriqipengyuania lutimaris TaxID=1538146 RepID=A0A395LM96_9SPHN|nr:serine hydrolase [Alteriqipengyuania lutimaris]MBB3033467.1 CubicO group peptidase (beta-lactamase class C family) [Alteriqipengyuania lutimaris]RDS77517.1 class C beta-lactamase-related serine hydrolase [Alteriqipengyuania lutimaris]
MRLTRRMLIASGGATMAASAWPARAQAETKESWVPDDRALETLETLARKHSIPGASAAIYENGDIAWTWAYGVQSVASGKPVGPETLFQAASLSKPVTAYVTMQMIEHGLLGLDDRLIDYHRPERLSDNPWSTQVTVRHALTHATGLPNWPERDETTVIEPAFAPGTGYSYSGQAFQWVQAAIERISGHSLQELCSRYLFAPAALDDMAMLWLPGRVDREALGHVLGDDGVNTLEPSFFDQKVGAQLYRISQRWGRPLTSFTLDDYRAAFRVIDSFDDERLDGFGAYRWERPQMALANAASSLRTTPTDYARFLALMLPPPPAQREGLLPEAGRALMLTPQTERDAPKGNVPAGIGWGLERREGRIVYHHWGMNGQSYVSNALGDPALRRTIVVMSNGSSGGPFIDQAALMLTGTPYANYV